MCAIVIYNENSYICSITKNNYSYTVDIYFLQQVCTN